MFAAGAVVEERRKARADLGPDNIPVVPASVASGLERRRSWTSSGRMPPALAAHFTMGEAAAMSVIVAQIAARGQYMLAVDAIAGRVGHAPR